MCAKIFSDGVVPPTMNCDNPDIEAGCDLDYVPNKSYTYATKDDIPNAIVSDNLGFGKRNILYLVPLRPSFFPSFLLIFRSLIYIY